MEVVKARPVSDAEFSRSCASNESSPVTEIHDASCRLLLFRCTRKLLPFSVLCAVQLLCLRPVRNVLYQRIHHFLSFSLSISVALMCEFCIAGAWCYSKSVEFASAIHKNPWLILAPVSFVEWQDTQIDEI